MRESAATPAPADPVRPGSLWIRRVAVVATVLALAADGYAWYGWWFRVALTRAFHQSVGAAPAAPAPLTPEATRR
jgi:hypothetical protein